MARKKATPEEAKPKTSAAMPTWFLTGEAGAQAKQAQDKSVALKRERYASRFMMKPMEENVKIVFLDGSVPVANKIAAPIYIYEHNLEMNGRFGNFFTCLKDITNPDAKNLCPICKTDMKGSNSSLVAYFTVIDTRSFTSEKTGQTTQNRRVLYPAKANMIYKLNDLIKKHGSLRGLVFKVKRFTGKESNSGTDLEFIGRIKEDKLQKQFKETAPLDYAKILAPMAPEELASFGFESAGGSDGDDDKYAGTGDADLDAILS